MVIKMFGFFKQRSPLGRFLDKHRITQEEFSRMCGVNRNTISKVCNQSASKPNMKNANKIMNAARRIDPSIDYDDFWSA
jgi:transcriptional regulator with XRE-family HTH domain